MGFFKKNNGGTTLSTIQLCASSALIQSGVLLAEDLKHLSEVVVGRVEARTGTRKNCFPEDHPNVTVVVKVVFKNWNPYLHLPSDERRYATDFYVRFWKYGGNGELPGKLNGTVECVISCGGPDDCKAFELEYIKGL